MTLVRAMPRRVAPWPSRQYASRRQARRLVRRRIRPLLTELPDDPWPQRGWIARAPESVRTPASRLGRNAGIRGPRHGRPTRDHRPVDWGTAGDQAALGLERESRTFFPRAIDGEGPCLDHATSMRGAAGSSTKWPTQSGAHANVPLSVSGQPRSGVLGPASVHYNAFVLTPDLGWFGPW
jgi:hypothetical protein